MFLVAIFTFYLSVVVMLQWAGGAFEADIGALHDDSAHYVTGLMVRDYIAARAPSPPMQFAKDYFLHYPRVGLGHWPPFFYVVEAVWMLVFSASTVSVMLMMALLTALLALTTYLVVGAEFGRILGAAAGLLLICLPLVQKSTGVVMLEVPTALLSFWAVLLFARYLDSGKWIDSAGFGVIASLAILTHGVAFFLALVPPIGAVLQRRVRLLAHSHFWLPAVIVLALCGPWYLLAPGARHEYAVSTAGLNFAPDQTSYASSDLLRTTGAVLLALMVIGLIDRVPLPLFKGKAPSARWACAAAAALGFFVFRVMVSPAIDPRHLVVILPAAVMFSVAGLVCLSHRLPMLCASLRKRQMALASIAGLAFGVEAFTVPRQPSPTFSVIAKDLVRNPEFQNSVFLISSDASEREGQFIAQVARHEKRPGHFVLRATKTLAKMELLGNDYSVLHRTPDEMMRYLESVPVGVLVMDNCPGLGRMEHQSLLKQTLEHRARDWRLVSSYPCPDENAVSTSRILVYSLLGHTSTARPEIRLDMRNRLNEVFVNSRP